MQSLNMKSVYFVLMLLLSLFLLAGHGQALADDDADEVLNLLTGADEQIVTTSRSPRPISKIAENVTVITRKQIEELHVHTVPELLQTIPGIQFSNSGRTPGQAGSFSLQGAEVFHLLVMIDGISQSTMGLNWSDLGIIPVYQIERVEIIKGAASAAWGQALGGVINIITKSPEPDRPFSGSAFSSIGSAFTTDQHAEFSGTVDRFGYYLAGGILHSDGLLSNNDINQNTVFGKFAYQLPAGGNLTLTLDNNNTRRGLEEVPPPDDWRDRDSTRRSQANLHFEYPLAEKLTLELLTFYTFHKQETTWGMMTSPLLVSHPLAKETDWGARGKLVWGDSRFNATGGFEYEHDQFWQREPVNAIPDQQIDKNINRYGVFANGTLSSGPLTILPGIRYDKVDADHNEVSWNLGVTWRFTDKTVLRAYAANGYSRMAPIMKNTPTQKGWTVQTGIETGDIPYVWFKGTLFYNDTWNLLQAFSSEPLYTASQVRQGVEIEGRTVPLYGFSLSAGYTLTDLRDKETRDRVTGVPGDLLKLAVRYDNPAWGCHAILTGNYVWWNNGDPFSNAVDRTFLWDLHLTQHLQPGADLSPELFLNIYNLGNNAQYSDRHYPNAGRWLEGGVRFTF